MKKFYGQRAYVQSAGVQERHGDRRLLRRRLPGDGDRAVPPPRRAASRRCRNGATTCRQFDLIVALSPASQRQALELTRYNHLDVEYWPILDPTGLGETREAKLAAYRQARDQIRERMIDRFGPPTEPLGD